MVKKTQEARRCAAPWAESTWLWSGWSCYSGALSAPRRQHRRIITYDYTGQPFDLSAPNCVQTVIPLTCVTGQVTGSVTFNIPSGFTGDGVGDITAYTFNATGTGVTTSYPCSPVPVGCTPFSVLDFVDFKNGSITSASLFTIGAAVQGFNYPFNGPAIDILPLRLKQGKLACS